jgi:Glyoxalase-like domain
VTAPGATPFSEAPVRWTTAFIDLTADAFVRLTAFWEAVTGFSLSPTRGVADEFATLVPDGGDAFLRVQRLGRGASGCHLDLHTGDVDGLAARARRLGADLVSPGPPVVVLSSPAGLIFCAVGHHGEQQRAAPRIWPGGHRSLVDQVCIDIPAERFGPECAFWEALTGWEHRTGSRPELHHLARPGGMPLRFLLQRLDHTTAGRATAHLDLACTDVAAERRRHEALGAIFVARSPIGRHCRPRAARPIASPAATPPPVCSSARPPRARVPIQHLWAFVPFWPTGGAEEAEGDERILWA